MTTATSHAPGWSYALDDWYPVAMENELAAGQTRRTRLLGCDVCLTGDANGSLTANADGRELPVKTAYNHIWITQGSNPRALFDIPETAETDRRFVPCGVVRVKCSPLRAVENFLDIAHFPFVHTDILGAEPHTEVVPYKIEIDENDTEIRATQVKFFQPQAAKSAGEGSVTDYIYRVPAPMVSILYKTCPPRPDKQDVIALFVQPLDDENCDVWPWMLLYDDDSTQAELIQFQQMIFLQDRSILENQIPRRLPLDPQMEIPTRADKTSISYRHWLKRRGAIYGAVAETA